MTSQPLSSCCKAPLGLGGNTTHFYICKKCKMPCDLSPPEDELETSPSPTQGDAAEIGNTAGDFSGGQWSDVAGKFKNGSPAVKQALKTMRECRDEPVQSQEEIEMKKKLKAVRTRVKNFGVVEELETLDCLAQYTSYLESQLSASQKEVERLTEVSLKAAFEAGKVPQLQERVRELEKALKECSDNPGSSRRIVSQILQ